MNPGHLGRGFSLRCACIHDLAGLGHCSLAAVIPVLSAMGIQVCSVPTAVLSSHTGGYSGYTFHDFTPELPAYIAHWKSCGERFEGIYTGFLGSHEQIELVQGFLRGFRADTCVAVVDPVMGDNGRIYVTYTPAMCRGMRTLAHAADVITPNLTEAAVLLGESYADAPTGPEGLLSWAERLSREVAPGAVITGVPAQDGHHLLIAVSDRGQSCLITQERVAADAPSHGSYPGTGDVFSSVLTGALMRGKSLADAARRAAEFVTLCVRATAEAGTPQREGLLLEPQLPALFSSPAQLTRGCSSCM